MRPTKPLPHPTDPPLGEERTISSITDVLDEWYASHPTVRRLWAIEDPQRFRIIVALEPTLDGDETHPIWLANSGTWTHELQLLTDRIVQLERIDEPSLMQFAIDTDSLLVADLLWRDPGVSSAT